MRPFDDKIANLSGTLQRGDPPSEAERVKLKRCLTIGHNFHEIVFCRGFIQGSSGCSECNADQKSIWNDV
jgi:hypothetical protein